MQIGKKLQPYAVFLIIASLASLGWSVLVLCQNLVGEMTLKVMADVYRVILFLSVFWYASRIRTRSGLDGTKVSGWVFFRNVLSLLIPVGFALVIGIGTEFQLQTDVWGLVSLFAGVCLTALWEEMLFRYFAHKLLAQDAAQVIPAQLFSASLFALSHAVNIFYMEPEVLIYQVFLAFSIGMLFFGVYHQTRSFLLVVWGHIMYDCACVFCSVVFTGAQRYQKVVDWAYFALCAYCMIFGWIKARKAVVKVDIKEIKGLDNICADTGLDG